MTAAIAKHNDNEPTMGGAAVAAAAAVARAIKASGAIVHVEPEEFRRLLDRNADALVVHAAGGLFSPGHKYLMGYKGLIFYTAASEPMSLSGRCQMVEAKKIWIPG
jgi:hypothetical protein